MSTKLSSFLYDDGDDDNGCDGGSGGYKIIVTDVVIDDGDDDNGCDGGSGGYKIIVTDVVIDDGDGDKVVKMVINMPLLKLMIYDNDEIKMLTLLMVIKV